MSYEPLVFRPDELPSKNRGAGARTTPLVTAARGATSYLNGITEFEPGAAIAHHTHNVAESVMVIAGTAIVDIDGEHSELRTGDTTFVPANIPHHFTNASTTEVMKIFWTYGSLDSTRTIVETGVTSRVDAELPSGAPVPESLVREVAQIEVRPGANAAFEAAVAEAVPLFQRAAGARTLVLEHSEEHPERYRLVVTWESVSAHVDGFRGSPDFATWRALIADHIADTPVVEHVRTVLTGF